jgi:hypothetical protein
MTELPGYFDARDQLLIDRQFDWREMVDEAMRRCPSRGVLRR